MTDHTNRITPRDWQIQAQAEAAESYAARMAEVRRYGAMADALEALQAEVKHLNLHLKATQSGRDAALARLAEIERQEPVGYLYDWGHSSATGRDDETYTGFTKDKAHAEKHDNAIAIYAAAGASPMEPSESAEHWHSLYIKKCQELHDEKARLGAEIETLELAAIDDAERYAVPPPAAETVGGLAKAVKAARGGDAPPAPMRRFA